jgi:hypothetical protein
MCVAIFSESGTGYPTKEIFERCWEINHDGAGYAYLTTDDEWHIVKGFMTFGAFWDAWEKAAFEVENTVVIHLRWGTSGKMVLGQKNDYGGPLCHPGACHPFPVTDDKEKMLETEITSKRIIMHNGVHGNGLGDMSDTMIAIRDYVDPVILYIKDKKIRKMLTGLLDAEGYAYSSRWWIADGPDSYLLGNWLQDEESKIWYSKDDYLEPKKWEKKNESYPYWNNYNTARADTGQRIPEINLVPELVASDFKTKKLKTFSFAKWNQYERARAQAEKNARDSKETNLVELAKGKSYGVSDDETTIEVYNSDNVLVGLIDGGSGETIWEHEVTVDQDETRHCNDCGADPSRSACQGGLCPYCYAVVFPIDGVLTDTVSDDMIGDLPAGGMGDECPTCGEMSYLIDSTFDIGDTECCRCGCLFASTIKGRDGIVGWNEDTKAVHDELVRDLLRETNA